MVEREWRGYDESLDLNSHVHLAKDFVAAILAQTGLNEGVEEEKIKAIWQEIVGSLIANSSKPDSLKRGTLTLRVTQPAMKFHLEQMKQTLLEKIQSHLGKQKVKSLKFING